MNVDFKTPKFTGEQNYGMTVNWQTLDSKEIDFITSGSHRKIRLTDFRPLNCGKNIIQYLDLKICQTTINTL